MKRMYLIAVLALVTAGCGGGGSSDTPAPDRGGEVNTTPTLDDLAGVWDVSYTYSGSRGRDERYLIIQSNGDLTGYNYVGDSYDNGPNCYEVENLKLEDQGGGQYHFISNGVWVVVTVTVSDTDLKIVTEGGGKLEGVHTSLLESDFSPVCL